MGYLLGIDVGTTRSAAAVIRAGVPGPEMVTLGDHSVDIPSVVYAAPDGSLLFGEAAERRALTEPDRVAREFKRRIGDPTPIPMGEQSFTAAQLSALLAEHILDVVSRVEGGAPDRVAVTHPASWGSHKRGLFADALGERGLIVTFLSEPQAAALHYATNERVEAGATVAVYDLGGGTFDAAVVRKEAAGATDTGGTVVGGTLFTLLGRPEGVEQLGGADFDQAVVDHVRDAVPQAFEGLDESDPDVLSQMARLRRDCREAKEALSADTEVSIPVWLGETRTTVRLHRSDLEDRIRPRLEESVDALQRAIASAGLAASGPSVVLLVGGSSRIPLVAQLVSSELGRPVQVDADPKNAIGKGAVLALGPVSPVPGTPSSSGSGFAAAAGAGAGFAAASGAAYGASGVSASGPGFGAAGPSTSGSGFTAAGPSGSGSRFTAAGPSGSGSGAAAASASGAGFDAAGPSGSGGFDAGTSTGSGAGAALAADPGPLPWESDGAPVTERVPVEPPYGGAAYHDDPPTEQLPVVPGYGPPPPAEGATAVYGGYANSYEPATEVSPGTSGPTRSPALLIGAGGVVAALAVVGAVVFWPQDRSISNATPELPAIPTTTTAAPPPTSEQQQPQQPVEQDTPRTREHTDPAPRTTSQAVPPPPPPVKTTPQDPPSTKPTDPPATTTDPPSSTSTPSDTPPPDGGDSPSPVPLPRPR